MRPSHQAVRGSEPTYHPHRPRRTLTGLLMSVGLFGGLVVAIPSPVAGLLLATVTVLSIGASGVARRVAKSRTATTGRTTSPTTPPSAPPTTGE